MKNKNGIYLGIFEGHYDPSIAVVKNGKVLSYSEEERHNRYKHAPFMYPKNSLKACLNDAGVSPEDVAGLGVNWNLNAYSDGTMEKFYDNLNKTYDVDSGTKNWQKKMLSTFNKDRFEIYHKQNWRNIFGNVPFPKIQSYPHHYVHAFQSCFQSPFEESICITIDGSGDQHTTVIWKYTNNKLKVIKEITIPHSLGWFYAAITEYLGFAAYDGEYKVMGLAAYGRNNKELDSKMDNIIRLSEDGSEYFIDPTYIHYGKHSYSARFTDKLSDLFGPPPRLTNEDITKWHEDIAFSAQKKLEEIVTSLVKWAIKETQIHNVCVSGGVGLNIKMNSCIFELDEVNDIFIHPLCNDGGSSVGSALLACYTDTGILPEKLKHINYGSSVEDEGIEQILINSKIEYQKKNDVCQHIAKEISNGKLIAWVQGRMEAGPRALGQRSILADPRNTDNRDKVNSIIKFREYWRPFCPSMLEESASKYFDNFTEGPYMILSFKANDLLKKEAPAIVHIDNTSRVQFVKRDYNPKFHKLISEFEAITGVPVLLNTSYNIKGEPLIRTVRDSLRTFFSTGLDILVIDDYVIEKSKV